MAVILLTIVVSSFMFASTSTKSTVSIGLPLTPEGASIFSDLSVLTISGNINYTVETFDGEIIASRTSASFAPVEIQSTYQVTSNMFSDRNKGIQVHVTGNESLESSVLITLRYPTFSIYGYAAFIVYSNLESPDFMGYEYYALSTDYDEIPGVTNRRSTILLVGNINETIVNISPTQTVIIPEDAQTNSSLVTVTYGTTHSITLGRLQTLLISSLNDLTGTRIFSNRPLMVLSGHQCAQIPASAGFCEPFYVQVPPTHTWGQVFLLAPFAGRNSSQYYKLVASMHATQVQYRCSNEVITLNLSTVGNGHFLTIPGNSYCYLTSTSPIFLVQMAGGYHTDNHGDPAVAVVSPLNRHISSTKFVNLQPVRTMQQFITVTVQTQHFQPSQIHLDNGQLSCTWNRILNVASDDVVGYGCTARVTAGVHVVTHSGENGVLSVTTYGWSARPAVGYAYLTRMDLKQKPNKVPSIVTNLRCLPSPSESGDMLTINWDPPSLNPGAVNHYLVELKQYFSMKDSRELQLATVEARQLNSTAHQTMFTSGLAMYVPYHIVIASRNQNGLGNSASVDCFTQEGVASHSPAKISVSWRNDAILVTWQPLTLVEARGFIEYLISLKILLSSDVSTVRAPMNQSSMSLTGLDPNQAYEVTVGTATLSNGMLGPVSTEIVVAEAHKNGSNVSEAANTIAISVSVGSLFAVLIIVATICIVWLIHKKVRKSRDKGKMQPQSGVIYEELDNEVTGYFNPCAIQKEDLATPATVLDSKDQNFDLSPCPAYAATAFSKKDCDDDYATVV